MSAQSAEIIAANWGSGRQAYAAGPALDDLDGRSLNGWRELFLAPSNSWPRVVKRSVDVVIGTVLCLLTLVVVLGLMVGSAIAFQAKPLFKQTRIGRHGKHLRVVKIRSLPAAAPSGADKYQLKTVPTNRFGRFIRGTHLDELPQLWLVPLGRMSLVGPRPDMPHILDRFGGEHLAARSALRSGCTGLWQISCASGGMIYEAPEYDEFYAQQTCLRLDLWILWRTALQAVGGTAITLDDVPRWAYAHPSPAILGESRAEEAFV